MKNIAIRVIKAYKSISSRIWLSGPYALYSNCKYHPTCSEYTVWAIEKYGLAKGLSKGVVRVLKCNPLSHGGVDLP